VFVPAGSLSAHEGDVGSDVAIVQSITPVGKSRQLVFGGPNVQDFSVTVKARKAGTYYVVAGFLHSKSNLWFRGFFSNNPFWSSTVVTLDAGDSITVSISSNVPPTGRLT